MITKNKELKLLVSLGLDYVRWTQLTPMLLAWAFVLLMLVLLVLLNFQQQTFSALEYVMQWLMHLPLFGEYFTSLFTIEDGGEQLGLEGLKSLALKGWFVVSLLFMLVSMGVTAWLGPLQPWTLKRKIAYAGFACLLLLAGFIAVYFLGSEKFNGSMAGWMLNFSLWALLVFLGSVYSLSVAHLLDRINTAVAGAPDKLHVE